MRLVLLLLFCSSLVLSAPINIEKTQHQVIDSIVNEGANSFSVEIISNENAIKYIDVLGFTPAASCTLGSLTCPRGTQGYFTRNLSTKLETGEVYCAIYTVENIDRPMYLYTYTNPSCKATYKEDTSAASTQAQTAAKTLGAQTSKILDRQQQIKEKMITTTQSGDDFVDLTELIMAVATQDGKIIDIASTISGAEIKTNANVRTESPFATQNPQQSTVSVQQELAQNGLSKKGAAIFMFAPKLQDILDRLLFMLLATTMFALILFHAIPVGKKFFDPSQQNDIKSAAGQYALGVLCTLIVFAFPSTEKTVSGELKLTQTQFQSFFRNAVKETGNFAQEINIAAHDSIFSTLLKERGFTSSQHFLQAYAKKSKNEKLLPQYQEGFDYCNQYFDPNKVRSYVGSGEYLYPISEQELHKKWVQNNPNVATSPYFDLLRNPAAAASQTGRMPPTITQCGEWERALIITKKTINESNKTIAQGSNSQASTEKTNALISIVERQYKAAYEYGWMSAIFLPTIVYTLDMYDTIDDERRDSIRDAIVDSGGTGGFNDSVIRPVMESIPFLAVPGVGTMVSLFASSGESLGEIVGGNGLVKLFAGEIGKSIGGLLGALFGIYAAHTTFQSIGFVLITAVAMVMFLALWVEIFFYYFVSPFAIVVAIGTNQTDMLKKFISRTFNFIVKIIIFPISIFLAIEVSFLIQDIANWIISNTSVIAIGAVKDLNSSGGPLAALGGWLDMLKIDTFIGVIKLFGSIAALLLSYKIITGSPAVIFSYLGMDTDRFDSMAEEIKNASGQYGMRV